MNNPEVLRDARNESVVNYDKFLRLYPNNKDCIFCFYEGKLDHTYYNRIVDVKVLSETYTFDCGGKSKVLDIRNKIKGNSKFSKCKAMFFIDRDFDEQNLLDDVFETPCYSVENLYVNKYTLGKIIVGSFEVEKDSTNYVKIMQLYEQLSSEFHEKIYVFNAWLYFQRMKEREDRQKKKIGLEDEFDSKMDRMIQVSLDNIIVKNCSLEKLKELFPQSYEANITDLEKLKENFRYEDPERWFRGKQEFYFFCTFLQKVIEELGKCRKGKSNIFVKEDNMKVIELNVESKTRFGENMRLLSVYASVPQELYDYIEKMNERFKEVVS